VEAVLVQECYGLEVIEVPALVPDVVLNEEGGFHYVTQPPAFYDRVAQDFPLRRLARRGRLLSTACCFLRFSFIETTFKFERSLL
jgi:hypothetical protein